MASCQTTNNIELPPKPERRYIEAPKDLKDCAKVINYYEHLVEQWEAWGATVESLTKNEKEVK